MNGKGGAYATIEIRWRRKTDARDPMIRTGRGRVERVAGVVRGARGASGLGTARISIPNAKDLVALDHRRGRGIGGE
jgi:hypothetical protein